MSKIIFKPAPRTKWRFASGPVTEHLYTQLGLWDGAEVDDELLNAISVDEEDFEKDFEEEVGGYISQLEAEGVTDQKEILWRFLQTGLMAENEMTAKDIIRKFYQRIADMEEYLSECRGDRRQVDQILEEELDSAFDSKNSYWCLAYEDALEQLRNGGITDAVFSLCRDISRYDGYVRMSKDEDKKG